jgi:hypothetical protein
MTISSRANGREVAILSLPPITAEQIRASLLAIPAFLPATFCTGYLVAWFTDLHGFRQRTLVERCFWSVPLSVAVSTIASVLIAKAFSLTAVSVFFMFSTAIWLVTVGWEWLQLRRAGEKWIVGWQPLGTTALILAIVWMAVAILSLVDLERNHQLFMSVAILDQCARVNWTESILRAGIPPVNAFYFYKHPAIMRNYYFWYVLCASIARMTHLPARAVFVASSVWAGLVLAALNGLLIKYFFAAGARVRAQFLRSVFLLMVTGLDIFVILWNLFYLQIQPPFDLEAWAKDPVISWFDTLLWSPNHIAGLVCCMLALLLAWIARKEDGRGTIVSVVLIAVALASAFGLSIYVTFAFFLIMLAWAVWQFAIERTPRPAILMAAGGVGATVLLLPYLWELTHISSKAQAGSPFEFAIRRTIPPDGLVSSHLFQNLTAAHPQMALNFAKLILLAPGYGIELGFYAAVFLIYLVPRWRGRTPLTPAQRTMVFISVAALLPMSLIRSTVIENNDFGYRSALLLQYPLLLLGAELLSAWSLTERKLHASAEITGLPLKTPAWLRSMAALALIAGFIGTVSQALWFRFIIPLVEVGHTRAIHDAETGNLSHNAYISYLGYAQLNTLIPRDAIVQFNPAQPSLYWTAADLLGINHQAAIAGNKQGCGSELGGDSSGCPVMGAAIGSIFEGASADQARSTCRLYSIDYLVARIYDPVWKDKSSWVWTLKPVVSDPQFRALDCR